MASFSLPGKRGPDPEQVAQARRPMTRLEERRELLRARFTELQWDLGGAAYEMAARDYFRLDVLAKMAAKLQTVDAELAEIERLARLEQAGAAGACPGCGSLHAHGAVYCWRCGRNLTLPAGSQALVAPAPPVIQNGAAGDTAVHPETNGHSTGLPPDLDMADPALQPEPDTSRADLPADIDAAETHLQAESGLPPDPEDELAELDAELTALDQELELDPDPDRGREQPGG
jgi:hypothetical protein